jgi:L,D-peptidoglycan transpeptidase YkuD (ErfK/YbiS/YcfS/YnhG family)
MGKQRGGTVRRNYFALFITSVLIFGCSVTSELKEANDFFNRGNYTASLGKYEQIYKEYPAAADRVLFEMGVIHAYPRNEGRDYRKSIECFEKILKEYPQSIYRHDSEIMISQINNVMIKQERIIAQQKQIQALESEVKSKGGEILAQQKHIHALQMEVRNKENEILALQKKIEISAIPSGRADRVLIEKKERRLTLFSQGKALKTYKIALGGNPLGPKEKAGDNKTPEGLYKIDSRNRDSRYHLSLHISYPNEKDRKRARQLGVNPGGDIMIHGIKNGYSWVGEQHAQSDWTQGCIAVTDEEIEEIDRLVPNNTIVEIRP